MEVKQVYEFVNNATQEVLGETGLINEDLSNLVDVGNEIFNNNAFDGYTKALINHIGRVIFVNRVYSGGAPSVLKDGWEYGSAMQKVSMKLPEAEETEDWELEDGASYDTNVFVKPVLTVKFYNKKLTFTVPLSITEKQVKQSFSNKEQLMSFVAMIYTAIENTITVKIDILIQRTINNFIGETIHSEYPDGDYNLKSGVKAVNLLYLYNQKFNTNLTADICLQTPEFIRFACYVLGLYKGRLAKMSKLFNIGGESRFTPESELKIIMLQDFASASGVYLSSDTFNEQFVRLPEAETVAFWQGSGTGYSFEDVSKLKIKTSGNNTIEIGGVLCVMRDNDSLGVCNLDKRVKTHYVESAEFTNLWYKQDMGLFNDFNENFVVFFVA